MAYKDRDKQRAYQRDWVRHRRLQGSTREQDSVEPTVEPVIPDKLLERLVTPSPPPLPTSFAGPLTKEKQTSRKGFNE